MTEFETKALALFERLVRSMETAAAAQRFLAEQAGRKPLDQEVEAERERNRGV
jgi:hypothetical protein